VGLVQELPQLDPPMEFGTVLRARLEEVKGVRPGFLGRRLGAVAVAAGLLLMFGVASAWHQFPYMMGTQSASIVENQENGPVPNVQKDKMDSGAVISPSGVTMSTDSSISGSPDAGVRSKSDTADESAYLSAKKETVVKEALPAKILADGNGVVARGYAPQSELQAQPPLKAALDLKVDDIVFATREVFDIARRYGGVASVLPDTGEGEILLSIPGSQFEKVISELGRAGKIAREDDTGSGSTPLPPELEKEKAITPLISVQGAPAQGSSREQGSSRLDSNEPMVTIRVRLN